MRFLFPVSLFISAALLFCIQPMVAKVLLPVYGGTPAVWTICMLFFQGLLLMSYGYVWLLSRLPYRKAWLPVHVLLILLSFLAVPIHFQPDSWIQMPEIGILSSLLYQLGLPLLVIGASAPLLQFAYSQTSEKRASDPYFLYVASNIGSLAALLSYPWLIERFSGLHSQFFWWSTGYGVYLLLLGLVLFLPNYQSQNRVIQESFNTTWKTIFRWISLSFIPCSLMLGVTFYITTDVAATPLFWVLPLALYLLSFIITFASKPLVSHAWVVRNALFFLIFPVTGFILGESQIAVWQLVLFNLLAFFMLALLCHGELIRYRPAAKGLTLFYFTLSVGGVLAGVFNGLIAPRLFSQPYEYPLVLALSLLALPIVRKRYEWWMPVLVFILLFINMYLPAHLKSWHIAEIIALIMILIWQQSARSVSLALAILFFFLFAPYVKKTDIILQKRNFYGIKYVTKKDNVHALMSQTTLHGFQIINNGISPKGTIAYYGAIAPVTELFKQQITSLKVSIVGLGAGILVCQFRKKDRVTIIEIDKQVIQIAQNPDYFTYLRDCPAQQTLIHDDGRLALEKVKNHTQDLIIIDAFSSDSIPVHLLTKEAFSLYKQKIANDGAIIVHISNRHLNLLPVLTAAGRVNEMIVLDINHAGNKKEGELAAHWVLLTFNESLAFSLMTHHDWRFVTEEDYLWTDDYSNIIPLLKWEY